MANQPANVKDSPFNAQGDGTTDDTAAIQAAIDAAISNPDVYSGVFLPPGKYRITDSLILNDGNAEMGGFVFFGAGKAWVDHALTPQGTLIVGDSGEFVDKPLINIDNTAWLRLSAFTISGATSDTATGWATYGIRIQNRPGAGTGQHHFADIAIWRCYIGIAYGQFDDPPTHNDSNAADCQHDRVDFCNGLTPFDPMREGGSGDPDDCLIAVKLYGQQRVNYAFNSCTFGYAMVFCDATFMYALGQTGGSAIRIKNLTGYQSELLLRTASGGPNSGSNSVEDCKLDGGVRSDGAMVPTYYVTRLYEATEDASAGATSETRFRGIEFNIGSIETPGAVPSVGSALIHLRPGHKVSLDTAKNLSTSNFALVEADGGGIFEGHFLFVDPATVKGTGVFEGYSLVNCYNQTNFDRVDDPATGTGAVVFGTSPVLSTPTLTAPTFSAGSATAGSWPVYSSGTLLTSAEAGALEYDGRCFYLTAVASARQVVAARQGVYLSANYTLASSTSEQKLFDGSTNGAVALAANTTYRFRSQFYISNMAASPNSNAQIAIRGPGTVGLASIQWHAIGADGNNSFTPATGSQSFHTSEDSGVSLLSTNSGTRMWATIEGILRTSTAGTLIPSIKLEYASAAVIAVNAFFEVEAVGSSTVETVGDWT